MCACLHAFCVRNRNTIMMSAQVCVLMVPKWLSVWSSTSPVGESEARNAENKHCHMRCIWSKHTSQWCVDNLWLCNATHSHNILNIVCKHQCLFQLICQHEFIRNSLQNIYKCRISNILQPPYCVELLLLNNMGLDGTGSLEKITRSVSLNAAWHMEAHILGSWVKLDSEKHTIHSLIYMRI